MEKGVSMFLVTVLLFGCLLWPAPLPLLLTLVPCKTFVLQPKILTWNMGNTDALVFATLNSHNPSVIMIANVVFGTNPPINCDVLSKAFWWTRV
ncbi:putative germin-like protein 2-3 [Morella rubra]|uniref:Putative germin-like protein 2-3 n=1 Tax=Morella rubra TaxID=262757 RepID=A0A6A1V377_9ROSI|nr:putative germin-like protein 2-3 [Morella rubra]